MPLPTVEFAYEGTIYSPFSGLPADSEEGPNEDDSTLLFAYYGGGSVYGYISPRLVDVLEDDGEETDPLDLALGLKIDGGLILTVDTGWNGVNYYGFAPRKRSLVHAGQVRSTADKRHLARVTTGPSFGCQAAITVAAPPLHAYSEVVR